MDFVYFIRYRLTSSGTYEAIPPTMAASFPEKNVGLDNYWNESICWRIWNDISFVQLKIQGILC